jgi:hypothetical protein
MPAHPVADWPEVKATAIATGSFEEAAKLHGIKSGTVRQRAAREAWPVGPRVHEAAAEAVALSRAAIVATQARGGIVTNVTTADAMAEANADNSRRSRAAALRYSARTLEHAADLDPETALASASDVSSVVKVASVAGGWSDSDKAKVRVSIFAGAGSAVQVVSDKEDSVTR